MRSSEAEKAASISVSSVQATPVMQSLKCQEHACTSVERVAIRKGGLYF